ncbi:hypothetical protein [uncultured Flavonifractor sp.]|uniref:hypothetical protein n=1 Tax=uncultured Flavonifractor sp. TaxID=1193534 RepID=UPI001749F296|nr:hypothetical protein [uncultured Flavonifractor sp.]
MGCHPQTGAHAVRQQCAGRRGWPIRTAGENGREIPAGHAAFATGILDELPRLTAAHPAQ